MAHRARAAAVKAQLMGTRAEEQKLGRSQKEGVRIFPRRPAHEARHLFTRFGWATLGRVLLGYGQSADRQGL